MPILLTTIALVWFQAGVSADQAPTKRLAPTAVETYASAAIDSDGSLRLTTSDHRTIVVRRAPGQSSFRDPLISAERTAVGAQADYPNCCTSYDIPLQLMIYTNGTEHWFAGNGLPIFDWQFADGGRRVAYGQQTVHFACSIHYELRDIQSERLVESADIPEPCGQTPNPPTVTMPGWVMELRERQADR
jgi:hypothetical protein